MTASPISDLNPIFMACETEATFKLHSRGERTVLMDHSFFPSYRKTVAQKGEVLLHVKLPFTQKVSELPRSLFLLTLKKQATVIVFWINQVGKI